MFYRDFMEYHQDRFKDFSLLVFKGEKLMALLPANKVGTTIYSHQGLSYGGLLVAKTIRVKTYLEVVDCLLAHLAVKGFKSLVLKELPFIYHNGLSQEFNYLHPFLPSKCICTDSYFVISDLKNYKPNRNRTRALKMAEEKAVVIEQSNAIDFFWDKILSVNLMNRFKVSPVHTIAEIKLLMQRFPKYIKFYAAMIEKKVVAGVVLFVMDDVVHFQYSSGNEQRHETGALDLLFDTIIRQYRDKRYISFGSSSVDKSLKINEGLAYWKESFGAAIIPQNTYEIQLKLYKTMDLLHD